ncbi:hypothetical protein BMS3Abin02_01255 [bacterium BMS3Abin02]|nr:hypothetical protein BMS3Abin02_01255 [bacterium BMS3Abin02]GBE22483.1 hypothetical protein BMS3Bbin01_01858 [bacterium BMS3Bbin01]HDH26279.1 hypothetical protein [Actinomycetota bacterium]HDK45083.1 hypothetical protein [Actinomycetota bacterium]HDL48918.1 hypothetical protein [Actinomycetota bacterium]
MMITDLSPADAAERILEEADEDWARRFVAAFDRRLRTGPLDRFLELWDLSQSAAARIFGVSRQAFSKWLTGSPPASRAAAIADLAAATEILDRYVKRERIPAVVRRPAPVLGDRSLLELASDGQTRDVLEAVRAMFDLRRVQP